MVETDRPVLRQELSDVRDHAMVVSLHYFVEVGYRHPHEGHQRRHHNILAAHVRNRFDYSVGVHTKLYVVTLELLQVFRYYLLITNILFEDGLRKSTFGSLDVVVDHAVEKRAADPHRNIELRKLILCVLFCG